jgi:sulfonate dioxygenase
MAAAATPKQIAPTTDDLKAKVADKLFNPFYSPPGDDDGNETYQYAEFKVRLPDSSYLFY